MKYPEVGDFWMQTPGWEDCTLGMLEGLQSDPLDPKWAPVLPWYLTTNVEELLEGQEQIDVEQLTHERFIELFNE